MAHTRGIRPEVVSYLVAKGATGTDDDLGA